MSRAVTPRRPGVCSRRVRRWWSTHTWRFAPATTPAAAGSTLVDDTFADGNSQNQDLAHNSLWLFNGRTNNLRTDKVGSVTFDVTPAGTSSEAFWAYFTPAGSPLILGVGDKLSVSVTFSLSGFQNNGQDIRWGVLDSQGTRNTTNLAGGQNDATFIGDTGYGLDFFASGTGSPSSPTATPCRPQGSRTPATRRRQRPDRQVRRWNQFMSPSRRRPWTGGP